LISNLLGAIYTSLGRKDKAIASYRKAINLKSDYFDARYNFGMALNAFGMYDEAVAVFLGALADRPNDVATYFNLGIAYDGLRRYPEALSSYEKVVELNPGHAAAYNNMGIIHKNAGRYTDALSCYQRADRAKPDEAATHNNLAVVYNKIGKNLEAIENYRKALALRPNVAAIHNNLGNALKSLEKYEEAVACYRSALMIDPGDPATHNNMAFALSQLGDDEAAAASYQRAVELDRDSISYLADLLQQRALVCDWSQSDESLQRELKALEFGSTPDKAAHPFCFLALTDDAGFLSKATEAFVHANYGSGPAVESFGKRHDGGRIRIGYFSADFHAHATMYLMAELFEQHDRSKFEIHAFSIGPDKQDEMRSRLLANVDAFHDVRLMGDEEIVVLSRSLGIDIAIDLKGFTRGSRMRIFSLRAAPIQVNYLGYPGTLGAPYIDYILADPVLIPADHRRYYTEKVVCLPDSYQVNDSTRKISKRCLSRSDFSLPERGFVFCCFNNSYKIRPQVFDIWMRLLNRIEGSVLWLLRDNSMAERNLRKEAEQRGIDPERLIFSDRMPLADHLARHRLADLFLDTFNYNAHTTASDALWAGLPVLTKAGEGFASRVAASLLSAVGMNTLITDTEHDYEEAAIRLATNPHELNALKQHLSESLETTALFDAEKFARDIEAAYTHMIRRYRNGKPPADFRITREFGVE